jgi:hypothetical protein
MAWWFFREEAHEFAQEEDGEDGYEYSRRLRELSAALLETSGSSSSPSVPRTTRKLFLKR